MVDDHQFSDLQGLEVEAAGDADGIIGEPAASFGIVPASAEVVELP